MTLLTPRACAVLACLATATALVLPSVPAAAVARTAPATAAASAPAAVATPVHHAYVMLVHDTSGTDTFPDTQQQILDRIDTVLARWVTESDHLISSFTRAGSVRTVDADCSDPGSVHTTAWNAAGTLFPGVSFGGASGNHVIAVGPKGCGGGIGREGSDANGLSNGGAVYVDDNPAKGTQSLLHELGHNLSLEHAHATVCPKGGTCAVAEYGDDYAIMGTTIVHTPPYVPAALDSFERVHLHIAQGCEIPTAALTAGRRTASATYDLFGRGTDAGTRGLRITAPGGATYYLDWRNHTGRDADAYYGTSLSAAQYNDYDDGVTVSKVVSDGDSTVLATHPKADPSTGNEFAYGAGQSWTDSGVSVHVDATDTGTAAGATAQVTVTLTDPAGTAAALPVQQGSAAISGSAALGATLTAQPTGWTPGPCFRYQWFDDGTPITGARASTYTVPATAQGHRITVSVTGQQSGFQPRTATSAAVLAGTAPATAPTAPRSVRAVAGKASVSLSWAAPASTGGATVTGYQVQRSTDGTHWTVRATSRALGCSDTGLPGGARVLYRVRAVNAAGTSAPSASVGAVPYTAPSAPRALHARPGTTTVALSWTAPATAHGAAVTGYVLLYSVCHIGSRGCHPHTATVRARSVTLTRLSHAHRYHLAVIAVNRAGRGPTSAQITSTTRR